MKIKNMKIKYCLITITIKVLLVADAVIVEPSTRHNFDEKRTSQNMEICSGCVGIPPCDAYTSKSHHWIQKYHADKNDADRNETY